MEDQQLALAASIAAIVISGLALRAARAALHQAQRTEALRNLDLAVSEAHRLVDKAETLTRDTLTAASRVPPGTEGAFRPNEQEAFDLRNDANQPLDVLAAIDSDLRSATRRRLIAVSKEVARIRRTIATIGSSIDIKSAALEKLLAEGEKGVAAPSSGRHAGPAEHGDRPSDQ